MNALKNSPAETIKFIQITLTSVRWDRLEEQKWGKVGREKHADYVRYPHPRYARWVFIFRCAMERTLWEGVTRPRWMRRPPGCSTGVPAATGVVAAGTGAGEAMLDKGYLCP